MLSKNVQKFNLPVKNVKYNCSNVKGTLANMCASNQIIAHSIGYDDSI